MSGRKINYPTNVVKNSKNFRDLYGSKMSMTARMTNKKTQVYR